MPDPERELRSVMRRWRASEQRHEGITRERDELIRELVAAKVPYSRIAAITGLSGARIGQIKRRVRVG